SIAPPVGQAITAISCSDDNSTGDPTAKTISLNLAVLETVTCTVTTESSVQKTVETINRFLTKRADLILSTEPSSSRRLARLNGGFGNATPLSFANGDLESLLPFTARSTGGGNYTFSSSLLQVRQATASIKLAHGSTKSAEYVENYRFDAWIEAQYKNFDADTRGSGYFAVAHMGADYLVNENVLVGVMLSIDSMRDSSTTFNSTVSGTGWMVGPYITARLAPNLYFDGRIAGGTSNNSVSPFNTYTDQFDTTRFLAMASLSGDIERGNWTITPNASLSYFSETQDSYVDSTGATIPSQTVELGQLKIGPTFTGRFIGDDGQLYAPYFSVDAIYNLGETSGVTITDTNTPSTSGWRARLRAGVNVTEETGVRFGFGATYDGIGRSDFEAWGLTFDVDIPLQKPTSR
ncbi:MAG: autotransporter outer membrane beta-barrel domain-containing protein, partial [Pseudomonadota bacterium]